ncbi:MAG TPA: immunity 8 family protein [Candidatus Sulfotelmatobacter sp.]|nr:immunity 8 family protein [Candidatus Sulfotelmatobacter sp.]
MRAEVKSIHTVDVEPLELHPPAKLDCFCVWVRAMVGVRGETGQESFDIGVCAPKWLEERCQKDGFVLGRHYLVVDGYNVPFIKKAITKLIESYEGSTWAEIGGKIARVGHWEFEDYRPDDKQ